MHRLLVGLVLVVAVMGTAGGTALAGKTPAGFQISTKSVNFGRVAVGSTASANITVTNNTGYLITFNEIGRTGDNVFTIPDVLPCYKQLALGASCTLTAYFSPTETGHFRSEWHLTFSDSTSSMFWTVKWTMSGGAYNP